MKTKRVVDRDTPDLPQKRQLILSSPEARVSKKETKRREKEKERKGKERRGKERKR